MIALPESRYDRVVPLVTALPINTYFAQSVLHRHVQGAVWVDDADTPRQALIRHPYCMSLLVGDCADPCFDRRWLASLDRRPLPPKPVEWLQLCPFEWNNRLMHHLLADGLADEAVECCSRVNFSFNPHRHRPAASLALTADIDIRPLSREHFENFSGSVTPRHFWPDFDSLMARGMAWQVCVGGELACVAFSAFVIGQAVEIGIETAPAHRGRGLAQLACATLIDHCLAAAQIPVWSCRLENRNSYRLALRLGFEERMRFPYFGLRHPLSMT